MTESEKPRTVITFLKGPEGSIRSFQTLRLPATHVLNNRIGGPITVNETEFQSKKAWSRMVPIDRWIKENPDARIIEMTLEEWLKGAAK